MIVALVGNQNCGKTTLYNRLTGAGQRVGNWPGVTVAKHTASLLSAWQRSCNEPVRVVDLPGTYSLSAFSGDEDVTRRFLLETPPDAIVNVVDAAHLERNLYLTLQLLSLGIPVIVALNMLDGLQAGGGWVDAALLAQKLRTPVIPICARNGQGIGNVVGSLESAAPPEGKIRYSGAAGKALDEVMRLVPERRLAPFLFDDPNLALQTVPQAQQSRILALLQRLEKETAQSPGDALAAERYRVVQALLADCWKPACLSTRAVRIDRLLVCSRLSVPILLGVAAAIFWLAFGTPGTFLTDVLSSLVARLTGRIRLGLQAVEAAPWLVGLLTEGILPGIGSVLGFLPALLVLLLLMDLLEDSGYLARAAFLMDRPLRRMGLSGRSLFSLLLGFGCTVPAALTARGIRSARERRLTLLLAPLMSCSAKLPVYALVARAFFPRYAAAVVAALYMTGFGLAALLGRLAARMGDGRDETAFLLELPPLHVPSAGNALRQTLQHCREFLGRVLSLVILSSVAVWLLSSLSPRFTPAHTLEESLLGRVAGLLSPLLAPCGFGSMEAAAALVTGIAAKESIVSTLAVLAGSNGVAGVFTSPLASFSFLLFVLLYPPCIAALQTIRKELNEPFSAFLSGWGRLFAAWVISMLFFQMGSLLGLG